MATASLGSCASVLEISAALVLVGTKFVSPTIRFAAAAFSRRLRAKCRQIVPLARIARRTTIVRRSAVNDAGNPRRKRQRNGAVSPSVRARRWGHNEERQPSATGLEQTSRRGGDYRITRIHEPCVAILLILRWNKLYPVLVCWANGGCLFAEGERLLPVVRQAWRRSG